jgi:hypothetical protein
VPAPDSSPAAGRSRSLLPVAAVALVLGGVAAGWAAVADVPFRREAARAEVLEREVEALRAETAALRREVGALRFALQVTAASGAQGTQVAAATGVPAAAPVLAAPATPAQGPEAARSSEASAPDGPPRQYLHLESPTPAVTVRQGSTGALIVTNTDPALAGQRIEILAYTDEPGPMRLEVTVPPARAP